MPAGEQHKPDDDARFLEAVPDDRQRRVGARAGDDAGEGHQLINTGKQWLHLYIIADNPPVDGCHYPDSKKRGFRPQGKFFRMTETPYHAGEE